MSFLRRKLNIFLCSFPCRISHEMMKFHRLRIFSTYSVQWKTTQSLFCSLVSICQKKAFKWKRSFWDVYKVCHVGMSERFKKMKVFVGDFLVWSNFELNISRQKRAVNIRCLTWRVCCNAIAICVVRLVIKLSISNSSNMFFFTCNGMKNHTHFLYSLEIPCNFIKKSFSKKKQV